MSRGKTWKDTETKREMKVMGKKSTSFSENFGNTAASLKKYFQNQKQTDDEITPGSREATVVPLKKTLGSRGGRAEGATWAGDQKATTSARNSPGESDQTRATYQENRREVSSGLVSGRRKL